MKLKVDFDHAYTMDLDHQIWKKLIRCGFVLDPRNVEHPGNVFCRFIVFVDKITNERAYLEFVHQKSAGKGGTPGLSFRSTIGLEEFYKKTKTKSKIPLIFSHKNYDWKKDSVSRLPGWNFMGFKKNPLKEIFPWFTESEVIGKRKKSKLVKHPNGVYKIAGVTLQLNSQGLKALESLVGQKLKDKMISKHNFILEIKKGKSNRFEKIILHCKSLKRTKRFFPKEKIQIIDGVQSIFVKLNNKKSKGWDLQIIEG